MTTFPEPSTTDDLRGLLLAYLDFYRDQVAAKTRDMDDDVLRRTQVPSGWTPAGLITHLAFMERRWIEWGFLGEPVTEPWGDAADTGWVSPDEDVEELLGRLAEQGRRTRRIVEAHDLTDVARVGGRFTTAGEAPHLHWILLHVLQEYARHMGHLDVSRELADGVAGEER